MKSLVRSSRGFAIVAGLGEGGHGVLHRADIGFLPSTGCSPSDLLLHQLTKLEQMLKLLPLGQQDSPNHIGGFGKPICNNEGAAVPSAPDSDESPSLQTLYRFSHRGPTNLQFAGEISSARQTLTGDELSQGECRDEPIGDAFR